MRFIQFTHPARNGFERILFEMASEMRYGCLIMKTATIADLRNHFPSVFKWIQEGEQVEVTRRGRVVARLLPPLPVQPRKFKAPDFASIQRELFGGNPPEFTPGDSAFIRDRGDR